LIRKGGLLNWKISVEGMHCNACPKLIEQKLSTIEGVKRVQANLQNETVEVKFNPEKITKEQIEKGLNNIGYSIKGGKKAKLPLKQAIIYGLIPHIGCMGFIIASILGATIFVELFKPLLMNPYFFHILIAISFLFATIASVFYLNSQGMLSVEGIRRKKGYLAVMYSVTIGVNILLMLLVFPMLANLDTGSFNTTTQSTNFSSETTSTSTNGVVVLGEFTISVEIPCPGHASLITGEVKKVGGVTGVRFLLPNKFEIAYSNINVKDKVMALEVFKTYPAKIISE